MKSCLSGSVTRVAIAYLAAIVFLVPGLSGSAQSRGPAQAAKTTIEYSRDADDLIISYTLSIGEIAESDRGPRLQIFGDGFAYVHYPVYMTKAGEYGIQLSDNEMLTLLESLVADGVVEFDTAGTRETLNEIDTYRRENEGVLHYVSDPSVTVIEVNLVSYSPTHSPGLQQADVSKTLRWSGLEADAMQYPDYLPIQNLASAERGLRAFMERTDLVKLDVQVPLVAPVPGSD